MEKPRPWDGVGQEEVLFGHAEQVQEDFLEIIAGARFKEETRLPQQEGWGEWGGEGVGG